jgi:hypothetical protein
MPLTMRPTGGHSPIYADRQDWTIFDDGKPVGRIYEHGGAGPPADLRWFWSIIVYVHPRAGMALAREPTGNRLRSPGVGGPGLPNRWDLTAPLAAAE